jgi:uncharacterized protein YkwD
VRASRRAAALLIGAAFGSLGAAGLATADDGTAPPQVDAGDPCAGAPTTADAGAQAAVLRMVNGARARAGLPRLRADGPLASFALRHSRDMAGQDRLAHSKIGGRLPFAPPTKAAGETLAVVETPVQAVQGWLGSPHHRAALLSREFRFTGVGAVRTCTGSLVITQEFLSA